MKRRFVVHEHHASRLHFDFRLEKEGVARRSHADFPEDWTRATEGENGRAHASPSLGDDS